MAASARGDLPADVRYCRLRLGQPEGHLHGTVQVDGGRDLTAGFLTLPDFGIESPKAVMAMGLEWAHSECLGQVQGLLVVRFGLFGLRGIGVGMDGTKLVQRQRLLSAGLDLHGQVEGLVCVLPGLLAVSHQSTDITQPSDSAGYI